MANKLNGFLDNIVNGALSPKGDMADFQHAARLYVDDAFRLAPKHKFLYHVVFEINPDAVRIPQLDQRHKNEIGMLVKSIDLPSYSMQMETKHKYNRKKNVQTRLDYDPINLVFHDDNFGVTTLLWEAYYRYYFKDGNYTTFDASGSVNNTVPAYASTPTDNTYQSPLRNRYRYGLDNDSSVPFFKNIQIFQLSRHQYTGFMLINPKITNWKHDTMDQTDAGGMAQSNCTVAYESVLYSRGPVSQGSPRGFGQEHYDTRPSPITLAGGGTSTLFGQGGVLAGIGDIFGAVGNGTAFTDAQGNFSLGNTLGTVLSATNTFKNAKELTSGGIVQEGINIFSGGLSNIINNPTGGISDVLFPNGSANANEVLATQVSTDKERRELEADEILETIGSNSSVANATAQQAFNLGLVGSGGTLNDFNNLTATQKTSLVEEATTAISNGDSQITGLANNIVHRASETKGLRNV
jgi:hypothetical protein